MRIPVQNRFHSRHSQRGAVAIVVGLTLFVLVGMLGLVLDLGHLYVAKTELQNAADAAALSGAKQIDGTAASICCGSNSAAARAIEAAGKNKFDLGDISVVISNADLWVSNCPDDTCSWSPVSSITTDLAASDKTFLKVDTGLRTFRTWFIQVMPGAPTTTATFGMAVAGKYNVDITPIAICRIPDPGTTNEFGYERGVTYRVSDANPIGPGTMFWIDPQSNVPGVCTTTSTNATLPYVCSGKTAFTPIVGQTVNTNTGVSDPQLAALDSRFDDYPNQAKCDPSIALPDTNIKEYIYSDNAAGSPRSWMNPDPSRQSIRFGTFGGTYKPVPYASRVFGDYGVLWSAFRPTGATTSQWSTLYPGGNTTSYPETSPYAQTMGSFYAQPSTPHRPGKAGRRVMNMLIVNCSTAGGVCRPATVLGIGKFFMQIKANQPGNKDIYVEFGGVLSNPLPTSDIKLYR